ncbi:MAG: hypothetical protein LBD89_09290 [Tannerellaceae bacterium]|jgi:hypothetical protein|nr:hypothetical protein [Tannerellaceae bacterium]
MATNKKRKKTPTQHRPNAMLIKYTKTYLDACYAATKRIFRAMGEDPEVFETFTKRQKQDIFRVQVMPPRIQAMAGHRVPKPYLRYVQEELLGYLKRAYYDKDSGVTWMDLVTTGQVVELTFGNDSFLETLSEAQLRIVRRVLGEFKKRNLFLVMQEALASHIKTSLLMLSQPNFRTYGQEIEDIVPALHRPSLQPIVRIVTHECQSLRFKYHNRERTAFRIGMGKFLSLPYTGATIPIRKIMPNARHDRLLNIYIQSHAIYRFKERIDTFFPILRNQFFVLSFMIAQKLVRAPNGMQLLACVAPLGMEDKTIGYFAFTIDGDNLLVLTLLPLLSQGVPEGHILHERLHLSPDELKYLGMDRLSFFYDVDISRIPLLKKVLFDELHLDYIRKIYNSYHTRNDPYDDKKTLFVKNYFQKLEEQLLDRTEVFNEISEPDMED